MKVNTDKAAGYIAKAILKVQNKFSEFLGQISASWKAKQKWIFLYMVCLVFGGLSVMSVVRSSKVISKPTSIKVPRNIHENSSIRITNIEFRQVQKFKRSLDSASKLKLLEERPGLMDSLEMVEQLYYSQKK